MKPPKFLFELLELIQEQEMLTDVGLKARKMLQGLKKGKMVHDPCLHTIGRGVEMTLITIYVDDIFVDSGRDHFYGSISRRC